MISKRYRDYLKSAKWQQKRQEVFRHYGKRCYACRTTKGAIQIHHMDYRSIFNERMEDVIPLCVNCHKRVTYIYRRSGRRNLRRVTMEFVKAKRAGRG